VSPETLRSLFEAGMAGAIAEREGTRIAPGPLDDQTASDGLFYVTTGGFGRSIGNLLIPLEGMSRQAALIAETGVGDPERAIQFGDLVLQDAYGDLQDFVFNPILSFLPTFRAFENGSASEVYRTILQTAEFGGGGGGGGGTPDPAVAAARALLFTEESVGGPQPTEVLTKYEGFERAVDVLEGEIATVDPSITETKLERLKQKLERLKAEWLIVGKRREVEEAFDLILAGEDEAGFEHERRRMIANLEAWGRERRPGAAARYYETRILPSEPLFAEVDDGSWKQVRIEASDLMRLVQREAFFKEMRNATVMLATKEAASLEFQYIVCDLVPNWLDPDLFEARYWREHEPLEPVSDGRGSGRWPCRQKKVVFVRNVRYVARDAAVDDRESTPTEKTAGQAAVATSVNTTVAEPSAELLQAARAAGLSKSVDLLNAGRSPISSLDPADRRVLTTGSSPAMQVRSTGSLGLSALRFDQIRMNPSNLKKVSPREAVLHVKPITPIRVVSVKEILRARFGHRRPFQPTGPKPARQVVVSGTVVASVKDAALLSLVSLEIRVGSPTGSQTKEPVALRMATPTRGTYRVALTSRPPAARFGPLKSSVTTYVLAVMSGDAEIGSLAISMGGPPDVTKDWLISGKTVASFEGLSEPALHGYMVSLVPACPNPDETLFGDQ
jgi:hypothetical protein